MSFPQRLPIVNGDDGQWGDILVQWLKKEHYDDGTDNAVNGGHKTVTLQAGTATAGTAPLKLASGTLLTSAEAGAVEFNTDTLYFTVTTSAVRKTIAMYDDSSGATGDIYYRNSSGGLTRVAIGSTNNILKVSGGVPTWSALAGTFADNAFTLQDDGDATKQLQFQLSGIASGNTRTITAPDSNTTLPIASQVVTISGPSAARTYTFPDANATIARTDAANTFTGHQTIEGVTSTGATGTGKFVFDGTPTISTPVFTGLPTGSGVASAATASTLASRDSNANMSADNFLAGYATTATAAGTTTLTVNDKQQQFFTGSTTQTVTLPDTSTLALGHKFLVYNSSSGVVTVQSNGSNTVQAMAASSSASFTCISTSDNTAAAWGVAYLTTGPSGSAGGDLTGTYPNPTIGSGKVTNAQLAGSIAASKLVGTDIATVGTVTAGTWTSTKIGLAYGGTNADLSGTGGASQILKQNSSGAAITVGTLAHSALTGLSADDHTQYALLAGRSGGQNLIGGTGSGDNLTLKSSSNGTVGKIIFGGASGTTAYDEVNDRIGIGTNAPSSLLNITGSQPATVGGSTGTAPASSIVVTGATGGSTNIITSGTGGAGADTTFTTGTGGQSTGGVGNIGGRGGNFTINSAAGGQAAVSGGSNTNTGGVGGGFTVAAGAGGGAIAGTALGGDGGAISLTAGTGGGGSIANVSATGGAGGAVTITSGTGGAATASGANPMNAGNGGDITLTAGIGGAGSTSNGTAGRIFFQTGTTTTAATTKMTIATTNIAIANGINLNFGTSTGTQIGTGTLGKLAFFGTTPVVQQAAITVAPAGGTGTAAGGWDTAAHRNTAIAAINSLITTLQTLGLTA
ncbi:MAG TPA: hypothetical protein VLF90_00390 [Patescibacteria group bacterium]|nr:hypothetical protein [Patescibacteria group bacterium]